MVAFRCPTPGFVWEQSESSPMATVRLFYNFKSQWKGLVRNRKLHNQFKRLVASFIWFSLCAFAMAMVQINGDALHAKHIRSPLIGTSSNVATKPLKIVAVFDIIFENFPAIPKDSMFNPDLLLHSFIMISIIAAIIHWPIFTLISRVRRYLWLYGTGYLLRMCTLAFTILPPSNPTCIPQVRTWWETVSMTPALLFGKAHTCTDKLFSGHTTVATLLLWFWLDARTIAGDRIFSYWRIYPLFHFFAMITSSILGLNHYTVDIVLSAIINTLTYTCYNYALLIYQHQRYNSSFGWTLVETKTVSQRMVNIISWCDGADISTPDPPHYGNDISMEVV